MPPDKVKETECADARGVVHTVRAIRGHHESTTTHDQANRTWETNDAVEFIVDGRFRITQDRFEPLRIQIPEAGIDLRLDPSELP